MSCIGYGSPNPTQEERGERQRVGKEREKRFWGSGSTEVRGTTMVGGRRSRTPKVPVEGQKESRRWGQGPEPLVSEVRLLGGSREEWRSARLK